MESLGPALAPFSFLSGVGLLILSTSTRFINVKNEILKLSPEECKKQTDRVTRELNRARLLRNALNSLYVSVVCFSLASLVGAFGERFSEQVGLIGYVLATAGVTAVVLASAQLVRDSRLSLEIVRSHADERQSS